MVELTRRSFITKGFMAVGACKALPACTPVNPRANVDIGDTSVGVRENGGAQIGTASSSLGNTTVRIGRDGDISSARTTLQICGERRETPLRVNLGGFRLRLRSSPSNCPN